VKEREKLPCGKNLNRREELSDRKGKRESEKDSKPYFRRLRPSRVKYSGKGRYSFSREGALCRD